MNEHTILGSLRSRRLVNSTLPSSHVFKAVKYISVCWRRSNFLWAPACQHVFLRFPYLKTLLIFKHLYIVKNVKFPIFRFIYGKNNMQRQKAYKNYI